MPESLFTGEHVPKQSPKAGTWASMNWIQRTGVISSLPLLFLSWTFEGTTGNIIGVVGWTAITLGYVAGNLWRFRHALHFWWSVAFALMLHAALIPMYIRITEGARFTTGHGGKAFLQMGFFLMIAEVLVIIFVLKRIAMAIHRRAHPEWQERKKGE